MTIILKRGFDYSPNIKQEENADRCIPNPSNESIVVDKLKLQNQSTGEVFWGDIANGRVLLREIVVGVYNINQHCNNGPVETIEIKCQSNPLASDDTIIYYSKPVVIDLTPTPNKKSTYEIENGPEYDYVKTDFNEWFDIVNIGSFWCKDYSLIKKMKFNIFINDENNIPFGTGSITTTCTENNDFITIDCIEKTSELIICNAAKDVTRVYNDEYQCQNCFTEIGADCIEGYGMKAFNFQGISSNDSYDFQMYVHYVCCKIDMSSLRPIFKSYNKNNCVENLTDVSYELEENEVFTSYWIRSNESLYVIQGNAAQLK